MGFERGQGRTEPGQDIPKGFTTKDPGFFQRKKMVINCKGYIDKRTGERKVAPGHKAREIIFTQDAHQVDKCDKCQYAYRQSAKSAWQAKKMKRLAASE
jgi:hypothetical protein